MNAAAEPCIRVLLDQQLLLLEREDGRLERSYMISSAAKGVGEQWGSECTPRGRHRIRRCIGAGCAENTVFAARRPTGELYSAELARRHPNRDWILTRILWLEGIEEGFNRGGRVDTGRRHIYIHGTPDQTRLGIPGSHGCIRMSNQEIIELYNAVREGTPVFIHESADSEHIQHR